MAAELGSMTRLAAIEQVVTNLGGTLAAFGDRVESYENMATAINLRMSDQEESHANLTARLNAYSADLNRQKVDLMENLNDEFEKHKVALQHVISEATAAFTRTQGDIQWLYGRTSDAFLNVQRGLDELRADVEANRNHGGQGGGGAGMKGFLQAKQMVPDKFGKVEEAWRRWQEEITDYAEAVVPGMRAVMKRVEKTKEPATMDLIRTWVVEQPQLAKAAGEGVNLYRLLKKQTENEAHTVMLGIAQEDGFKAWQALHTRYGLSLAGKQAKAMNDVCAMITKPARNPKESRTLITELERRIHTTEELSGKALDDEHKKSILGNVLDEKTKTQAVPYMGSDSTYEDLKRFVLQFANHLTGIAAGPDPDAMQIGQLVQQVDVKTGNQEDSGYWENLYVAGDQHLDALSPNMQCYKCGGYGHRADQCATPGKGKGTKGGGKADGKGFKGGKGGEAGGKGGKPTAPKGGKGASRGPQFGDCFLCKGAHGHHYQKDCPLNRGKGGYNVLAEQWPTIVESQQVRMLSAFRTVETKNRFAILTEEDEKAQEEKEKGEQHYFDNIECKHQGCCGGKEAGKSKEYNIPGRCTGRICPLATIEPETICPIAQTKPEWVSIEMAVDSGASETVLPPDQLTSVKLEDGPAKRRGVSYEVANGDLIPNLGERRFHGMTEQGHVRGITAQVCEVNKPLLSVSKLVAQGNRVIFDASGSYVEDTTNGERMWLTESGGMYSLKLWVRAPDF